MPITERPKTRSQTSTREDKEQSDTEVLQKSTTILPEYQNLPKPASLDDYDYSATSGVINTSNQMAPNPPTANPQLIKLEALLEGSGVDNVREVISNVEGMIATNNMTLSDKDVGAFHQLIVMGYQHAIKLSLTGAVSTFKDELTSSLIAMQGGLQAFHEEVITLRNQNVILKALVDKEGRSIQSTPQTRKRSLQEVTKHKGKPVKEVKATHVARATPNPKDQLVQTISYSDFVKQVTEKMSLKDRNDCKVDFITENLGDDFFKGFTDLDTIKNMVNEVRIGPAAMWSTSKKRYESDPAFNKIGDEDLEKCKKLKSEQKGKKMDLDSDNTPSEEED
ncbi:TPA_asm: P [Agave tequilana virus 1]|uniref:P n=1 Tax=Agave tequilana virus 1 TaxID=2793719 RepID=A0A8D9PH87_9RHAB|nr:P [Agave tequilana virus 1] [Agave tequilana virus 1]DAF42279.1 TPA_asm: P [Agave tequilana virus 1]